MSKIRLEDDFYNYINNDWLEKTTIPSDKPVMASFIEIMQANEDKLLKDLKEYVNGKQGYNDELFLRFISFYKQALDKGQRDKDSHNFILKFVDKIKKIKDIKDFEKTSINLALLNMPQLFDFGVNPNMKDSSINTLYFSDPSLILPEKGYYDPNNPKYQTGLTLLEKYKEVSLKTAKVIGLKNAKKIVDEALEFDKLLVPTSKSSEEKADYLKMYNPVDYTDFVNKSKEVDLSVFIKSFVNKDVKEIIVTNPKFLDNLDTLIKGNLELIKSWLILEVVSKLAGSFATEELRLISSEYSLILTGQQEPANFEKFNFQVMSSKFSDVVGIYFGKTYFGEESKIEVEQMVKEFIKVYKKRLLKNNWLSKETISKAIVKLNKIKPFIGYPAKIKGIYTKFVPSKATYYENRLAFEKLLVKENFREYGKKVDRKLWHMGAHVVNAYYEPMNNQIVFPAGILQKPFYSYNQTKGENYGGIGAVIAHEITHAFDTNGAQIDANGNINNWWKEEDFKAFNDKAEDMVRLFDGLEIPGLDSKCNGKLTVTENIADAAGLSCAYEAGKKHPEFNLDDFFKGWAQIWRSKTKKEYGELLANVDVHSPSFLRGQIQLKNFKEFSKHYKLTKKDKMYLDPKSRVSIW